MEQLTRISSIGRRVQIIEAELKLEKEQLATEIQGLNKTLEEQERAVKNYFDTIRQEIAKLAPNTSNDEPLQKNKADEKPNGKDTN